MGIRRQIYRSLVLLLVVIVALVITVTGVVLAFAAGSMEQVLQNEGITQAQLQNGSVSRAQIWAQARQYLRVPMIIIIAVTVAAVLIILALFAAALSRRILAPLAQLKIGADHIAAGDLEYHIRYTSNDEFGMVCTAFDDMQSHLRQNIAEKERYEKSRKELLAGISHDLRTPLTAIKGYIKGIQDGVANTPEKQQQYLQTAYNKAKDMETLVEKLFLFSKLDTGKEMFNFTRVGVLDYLNGYVQVVGPDMENKGVLLHCDFAVPPDASVWVDCDQMSRVFANILENSAKYKTNPQCHVDITARLQKDSVLLSFCDDGPGVPPQALKRLFESFYRADASRTSPQKGSGLGLAVAQRIVQAHGGAISAQNNKGLCITITLPLYKQKEITV